MVSRVLAACSVTLVGALAGGMVLIKLVLVPFWRGAPPAAFRDWFAAHSDRIRAVMVPLGAGAGMVAGAAAVTQVAQGQESAPAAVAAAGATAGVVAITVTVNEPANARFVSGELTDSETAELLGRWARWHDVRVVLGLTAAATATWSLVRHA